MCEREDCFLARASSTTHTSSPHKGWAKLTEKLRPLTAGHYSRLMFSSFIHRESPAVSHPLWIFFSSIFLSLPFPLGREDRKWKGEEDANDNTNIRFPFLWNLMFVPAVRRMSFARFLWVLVLACGSSTPTHTRTGTNRASVHRNLFITLPSSREKWRQAVSVFVFCLSPQLLSTESLVLTL